MGQQPGQPGVPPQGPYAPFPNQGAPAPMPPQAGPGKRVSKKAMRIIGTIIVAVLVLGLKFGAGWFLNRSDAETTSVGACMHKTGTGNNINLDEVDCSSSDAEYKVVEKFDGTDDREKCKPVEDAEFAYFQSGGGHDVVLCLKTNK
ncbi:hypothetical protein AB0L85_20010 [Streptomyces sp. NPDC052051]|uniref:LppU/SCO3897 family protein n=1 Tax=Streptomyces sp. NPDC052051 TaxID=3154649 RepID=UPI0034232402